MKKIILTILLIFFMIPAFSSVLSECYKIYSKDADELYITALSALSSDRDVTISEIQTKNGYILFTYNSKYYLLTLTKRYKNQTEIKILPQNSDYSDGSGVAQGVFKLIDNELLKSPMEIIK